MCFGVIYNFLNLTHLQSRSVPLSPRNIGLSLLEEKRVHVTSSCDETKGAEAEREREFYNEIIPHQETVAAEG